ncbi:MAG: methyl-accepting chemotaxis protein [Promethearchaeota archaeon]
MVEKVLNYITMEFSLIGFASVSFCVFALVCIRRKDLVGWVVAYFSYYLGTVFNTASYYNELLILFSIVFQITATISIFTVILKEYYQIFLGRHSISGSNKIIGVVIVITSVILIMIYIFLFVALLFILCFIMLFRIYKEKKTPTHAFLLISLCPIPLIIALDVFGILIQEIYTLLTLTSFIMMMVTGLVVLIENRILFINESLKKVLNSASAASTDVANIASELAANASEVNASAEEISLTTLEVARNTEDVMKSSEEIRIVMDLVNDVAEKTNLLSLNARIEAGRAGEHGRGFAVVADEVRKLSEESKKASYNSSKKVDAIINKIHFTFESMQGISTSSEQQTASMQQVTATSHKLESLAEELKTLLIEIEV